MKFKTGNLKLKIVILALMVATGSLPATPWFQTFYNPDGSPQTNALTFTAYPPVNTWVVVGTNMYYGAQTTTFTPNSSGYVSNQIAPNVYSVLFSNLNSGFLVNILNTTNVLPLSTYVTNVPTVSGVAFNGYGMVTNWLQFAPATNRPATNTIVYISGFTGITNAAGVVTNYTLTYGTNTTYYQQR